MPSSAGHFRSSSATNSGPCPKEYSLACGVFFPLAIPTSTWRSSVTICSGLYFLTGIPASLQSDFSLTHAGAKTPVRSLRINLQAAGHPTETIGVLTGHRGTTGYAASETDIESCLMATRGAGEAGYYETQSKFVRHDHPFGDDARFRKGLPSLEDILVALGDPYAKDAFDKLVRLKIDQEEIGYLLRMIGASSDEPIARPRRKRREESVGLTVLIEPNSRLTEPASNQTLVNGCKIRGICAHGDWRGTAAYTQSDCQSRWMMESRSRR